MAEFRSPTVFYGYRLNKKILDKYLLEDEKLHYDFMKYIIEEYYNKDEKTFSYHDEVLDVIRKQVSLNGLQIINLDEEIYCGGGDVSVHDEYLGVYVLVGKKVFYPFDKQDIENASLPEKSEIVALFSKISSDILLDEYPLFYVGY